MESPQTGTHSLLQLNSPHVLAKSTRIRVCETMFAKRLTQDRELFPQAVYNLNLDFASLLDHHRRPHHMSIVFHCKNVSGFDQATGETQFCEQRLRASSKQIGFEVRCPQVQASTKSSSRLHNSRPRTFPSQRGPLLQEVGEGHSLNQNGAQPAGWAATVDTSSRKSLTYTRFNRKTRCKKCGSEYGEDRRCVGCGHQASKVPVTAGNLDEFPIQPAGFQLWMMQILSDGVSPSVLAIASHAVVGTVVVALVLLAIGLGGPGAVAVWIGSALFVGCYVVLFVDTHQLAMKPKKQVPFYLKPIWLGVLMIARMMRWQHYDSKLKGRQITDVRGTTFGDRNLLEIDELNLCQVLDAGGSSLTDNGLAAMHDLKHLRCLVLRGTHVSDEGVFFLQQALPQCWIWR